MHTRRLDIDPNFVYTYLLLYVCVFT